MEENNSLFWFSGTHVSQSVFVEKCQRLEEKNSGSTELQFDTFPVDFSPEILGEEHKIIDLK